MASKSGELRMTLLALALLCLLLLSHHAAPTDATGPSGAPAGTGKRKNSFSFNSAGGRTLTSFSMNHDSSEDKRADGGH